MTHGERLEYERGKREAEDAFNAKVEALIDRYVAAYRRKPYPFSIDYASFLWANLARGGSKHPADRVPDDSAERALIAELAEEEAA